MVILVSMTTGVIRTLLTRIPANEEEHDAQEDLGAEGPAELRRVDGRSQAAGDRYIVNRGEKPLVAVIPVEEYLAWEQARERLYSRIVMMRDRTRREDAEVLEGEIRQAIAAVG